MKQMKEKKNIQNNPKLLNENNLIILYCYFQKHFFCLCISNQICPPYMFFQRFIYKLCFIAMICLGCVDILYAIYLLAGMFIEAAQVKYPAQCVTGGIEPSALLPQVQFPNHNQFAPLKYEVSEKTLQYKPHRA